MKIVARTAVIAGLLMAASLSTAGAAQAETCVGTSASSAGGYFVCTNATVGSTNVGVNSPITVCAGVCVNEGDTIVPAVTVPAGVAYDYICLSYWGTGASAVETATGGGLDC